MNIFLLLTFFIIFTSSFDIKQKNSLKLQQQTIIQANKHTIKLHQKDINILQQVLKSIFEQNNLYQPASVKYCFDDPAAHRIVIFTGLVLQKASKGSLKDILNLVDKIKQFGDTLDQQIDCVGDCPQMQSLGHKYNIDVGTSPQQVEDQIVEFIKSNFLDVHNWAIDLNNKWKKQKYNQFGFSIGEYFHKVFSF